MLGPAVELEKFRAEVRTHVARALLHRFQMARAEHLMPVPGAKTKTKWQRCQRVYHDIRRYSRVS
jgi:hypothetical protein